MLTNPCCCCYEWRVGGIESVITTGANTDGIWLRRAAIRLSHRILHYLLCLMTYQMTIWMFRRHDDFHSAAPIVEIAMQLKKKKKHLFFAKSTKQNE